MYCVKVLFLFLILLMVVVFFYVTQTVSIHQIPHTLDYLCYTVVRVQHYSFVFL